MKLVEFYDEAKIQRHNLGYGGKVKLLLVELWLLVTRCGTEVTIFCTALLCKRCFHFVHALIWLPLF